MEEAMRTIDFDSEVFHPSSQNSVRPRGQATVCVFCGSSSGADPRLLQAAVGLGQAMAEDGIDLVYGGGATGLMGAVAQGVAENGGSVVAVTPHFLVRRIPKLAAPHELIAVPDMHTRKKIMFERSDAFIALPGGIGTIEELTEVVTLHKLDQHGKPVLIANLNGFWSPLLDLFAHLQQAGFMQADALGRCHVADRVDAILPMLRSALGEKLPLPGISQHVAAPAPRIAGE
jgi:uncharacterized protein (TIGR00730 family)